MDILMHVIHVYDFSAHTVQRKNKTQFFPISLFCSRIPAYKTKQLSHHMNI